MKDEALKQVLEAITQYLAECPDPSEEAVEGLCDAASAAREALAQPEPYDQTALELCNVCGWKTLIPDDACLNCERAQPKEHEFMASLPEEKKIDKWDSARLADYNNGWNDCRKTMLTSATKPVLEIVNGQINRSWDAIPDNFTGVLYTTPPQRTWVGLTPQERDEINEQVYGAVPHHVAFHHAIEAKLKEKNT